MAALECGAINISSFNPLLCGDEQSEESSPTGRCNSMLLNEVDMTNDWIDLSSELTPPRSRALIVYCPEFCSSGYSIAEYKAGRFRCETHGSEIHQYVKKWALFIEAE